MPVVKRKEGYEEKYNQLIKENELLFKIDIMKDKLAYAYEQTNEVKMSIIIDEII